MDIILFIVCRTLLLRVPSCLQYKWELLYYLSQQSEPKEEIWQLHVIGRIQIYANFPPVIISHSCNIPFKKYQV
ncbi:hypothetical protein XELAEV_18041516mg [Xenopus laevis]|uniref:Uncharacterized protein n=1 Tax=Xenopus laevis TaxID=8355 RepID=A0A974C2M2_XENLA|nr:hypothetical protein XELAEV_18041516mg [Xenopus laevis]